MIRMIDLERDGMSCWWWYNWYITHSTATFETEPVSSHDFNERIRTIRKRYPWIVLEDDEKLLGYAYLNSFNPRAAYNWTADLSIYLSPDQCGKGYGRMLMKEIIDLARKDGYHNIASLITGNNTASMKLHESFGFVKTGTYQNFGYKDNTWLDVSYYVLKLCDPDPDVIPEQPKNLNPYEEVKPHRVPVQ